MMSIYNSKVATWWRRRRHRRYVAAVIGAKDSPQREGVKIGGR